jgi:hypothetical protein
MAAEEEGLDRFLESARARKGSTGEASGKAHQRIEGIFEELELPVEAEAGGWKIDTDVGSVMAGLSEDHDVLTLWQPIHAVKERPKKQADYLAALLRINASTTGACFCLDTLYEGDPAEWVMIVARLSAEQIDKEEVELALEGLLRMSAIYDQSDS